MSQLNDSNNTDSETSFSTPEVTALVIEKTLEAFGVYAKVAVTHDTGREILYGLELSVGTPVDDLLRLDKELALVTASPTGTIKIQAPIPGTTLIGIWVPKKGTRKQESFAKRLNSLKKTPEINLALGTPPISHENSDEVK